jgi:crossover junction endodeoxyribonuclease RuvC
MKICAVDPGLSGGICFHDTETRTFSVFPMPIHQLTRNGKNKREIDSIELARLVDVHGPHSIAIVELVGSMPGQGVSSSFAFGKGYGIVLGVLAANFIPLELIAPAVWKRSMGIAAGSGKDISRSRASALLPHLCGHWSRCRDDGLAESVLIALFAARRADSGRTP